MITNWLAARRKLKCSGNAKNDDLLEWKNLLYTLQVKFYKDKMRKHITDNDQGKKREENSTVEQVQVDI